MEETMRKQLLNSNTQPPDDEKQQQLCWPYCYQIDALKDDLEELDENHHRLQKELKEKTRAHDLLARDYKQLQDDHRMLQHMLAQRERLIDEHGLILIHLNPDDDASAANSTTGAADDQDSGFANTNPKSSGSIVNRHNAVAAIATKSAADSLETRPSSSSSLLNNNTNHHLSHLNTDGSIFSGPTLISRDIMELLSSFEGSNLEEKLKCMAEEREDLLREIKRLKLDLEEERQQNLHQQQHHQQQSFFHTNPNDRFSLSSDAHTFIASANVNGSSSSGGAAVASTANQGLNVSPSSSDTEVKKMLHEYKFRLKRAEQEISLLQGNHSRLETQLSRYKSQCEELEKSEEELKVEKRRILRELREFQNKSEDLETQNANLQKRIHKLQENRIAIITNGPAAAAAASPVVPSSSASASANNSNTSS